MAVRISGAYTPCVSGHPDSQINQEIRKRMGPTESERIEEFKRLWAGVRLPEVVALAKSKAASISLYYAEASDRWYGSIGSIAPSRSTIIGDGSIEFVLTALRERLETL